MRDVGESWYVLPSERRKRFLISLSWEGISFSDVSRVSLSGSRRTYRNRFGRRGKDTRGYR